MKDYDLAGDASCACSFCHYSHSVDLGIAEVELSHHETSPPIGLLLSYICVGNMQRSVWCLVFSAPSRQGRAWQCRLRPRLCLCHRLSISPTNTCCTLTTFACPLHSKKHHLWPLSRGVADRTMYPIPGHRASAGSSDGEPEPSVLRRVQDKHVTVALTVAFLLYSTVSTVIFQVCAGALVLSRVINERLTRCLTPFDSLACVLRSTFTSVY